MKKISEYDRASFVREYNILRHLLPWADFDLARHWRDKSSSALCDNTKVSSWIKRQCCGLTGAISILHRYSTTSRTSIVRDEYVPGTKTTFATIHHNDPINDPKGALTLYGRHGDMKPENILWYPDPGNDLGILRLFDFSTARFSSVERTPSHDKKNIASSLSYQSPASILPSGELSSLCDVWALGCMFLEFVCWYVGGHEVLKDFEKKRIHGYESTSFCCPTSIENVSLRIETKKPVQDVSASLQPTAPRPIQHAR